MSVVRLSSPFQQRNPIGTDSWSSFPFLVVNVALPTTSCRVCAARPSDLGLKSTFADHLAPADEGSLLRTQISGVVRPGRFFDVLASHGRYCAGCAEQCAGRSTRVHRSDYPLVMHGSARYGACACLVVPSSFMDFDLNRSNSRRRSGSLRKPRRASMPLRWTLLDAAFVTPLKFVCPGDYM